MKLNIKKKIRKEGVILFICIFIFSMIANNAFLQRHYSSDTMCLMDLGYFDYPSNYFLLDGRIISTLVCYLGGVFNLPFEIYLFISNIIGIMLLSLSIIILFKFIVKYLEVENKWVKFLVLFSIYTIIFNHLSIEYLLFPESCVMCAGVLFSVLAVIKYLTLEKNKLSESFCYLLLSTLCYQGIISIFPTLVIALSFLKMRKKTKETFKFYIKEMFKVGIMFILAMLVSALLILIFSMILKDSSFRLERTKNALILVKQFFKFCVTILIIENNKIPVTLSVLVMLMTVILILRYNVKLLLNYILVTITAYLLCIVPALLFGYAQARMLMAVGAMMGISLLYISFLLNKNNNNISIKNIKTVLISTCVISYFIFNVINNCINGYEHLKAFALDEKMGAKVNEIVRRYEEESGVEITKFSYCYDKSYQKYDKGIKKFGSLTERKFAMWWSIGPSVNYYCNKDLEKVRFPKDVYNKYFYNKNYTEFSEEQFVFIDDTLYMCVY